MSSGRQHQRAVSERWKEGGMDGREGGRGTEGEEGGTEGGGGRGEGEGGRGREEGRWRERAKGGEGGSVL